MTISYIYKLGRKMGEIERTYAYLKLDTDIFLVVSVVWNCYDKNSKKVAREFAKAKLELVKGLLDKTCGKLVPKGKYFYRHLTFEQLSTLKAKILWNNEMVKSISRLVSILNKGYGNAVKVGKELPEGF